MLLGLLPSFSEGDEGQRRRKLRGDFLLERALLAFLLPCSQSRAADPINVQDLTASERSFGDDPAAYLLAPFRLASQPVLKQSVFVFGGLTTATDIWSTAAFHLNLPRQKHYDNYIVGAAYQRDFFKLNFGLIIGGEVGIADRFGHYKVCCNTIDYSNNVVHSAELWGGLALRYGVLLFDAVRVTPGLVFGLSAISNPIGQEGAHQVDGKSARVLFYIALETAFALASHPNTELVVRLHHRSGGYGTLGGMKEGNNASVIGFRHHF